MTTSITKQDSHLHFDFNVAAVWSVNHLRAGCNVTAIVITSSLATSELFCGRAAGVAAVRVVQRAVLDVLSVTALVEVYGGGGRVCASGLDHLVLLGSGSLGTA